MGYKQQFFLALSVGIVALALLVSELAAIRSGRARLAFTLEAISALEHEREALDATRSLAERTARDRAALDEKFIPRDGVVAFLKRIEDLGKRSGTTLAVETLSAASPISSEASLEDMALRFTALGAFQNIVHLLALVESLPVAAEVTSARLEAAPAGEEGASLWRTTVFLHALKKRDAQ
ncbi:MAG: hypothetical protein Q8R39_04625 [bacterium]|nr:hypothetical protein [bacterium]MDZ4285272.1 hypothetical protein [Patescibacteria group bacterium]